jgi:hypothetical protein
MSPTDNDLIRTEASRSAGNQIARKRFHMFKADANNLPWGAGGECEQQKSKILPDFP